MQAIELLASRVYDGSKTGRVPALMDVLLFRCEDGHARVALYDELTIMPMVQDATGPHGTGYFTGDDLSHALFETVCMDFRKAGWVPIKRLARYRLLPYLAGPIDILKLSMTLPREPASVFQCQHGTSGHLAELATFPLGDGRTAAAHWGGFDQIGRRRWRVGFQGPTAGAERWVSGTMDLLHKQGYRPRRQAAA
jgi:hypothetical protein